MLLALTLSAFVAALPAGGGDPVPNSACDTLRNHVIYLGVTNYDPISGPERTAAQMQPYSVVNDWSVRVEGNLVGFVAKTGNGEYWFQPLVFQPTRLTDDNVGVLDDSIVSIAPCYKRDFVLP